MAETLPTGNRAVDYTYDDLYRLTEEQVTDPVHGNSTTSFTYDATGIRLTQTVDDGTVITTTYTYDANDRIQSETGTDTITWQYDANGNTVAKYINGSLDTTYDYNSQNRLIEADVQGQITNYTYDPSGIRQSSTTAGQSTNYLVDPNRAYAQVLEEQDHIGNANVIYSYGDDLLSQTRAEGAFIYHYDGLGSTRALSDQSGLSTDSYIYTAFGELQEQQGTTPNTYLYTGEQLDPNLGFYYLRARYYNPANGRFPSMDTWMGRSSDPRTLHKYLYTHADPVNGVDPSGNVTLQGVLRGIGRFFASVVRSTAFHARLGLSRARSAINLTRFMMGRSPKGQWGFWRDLPKVIKGGKSYARIRGRSYTREAINRMTPSRYGTAAGGQAGRGIPPFLIDEVILFGRASTVVRRGVLRTIFKLGDIKVVTEKVGRIVITIIKAT